MPQYALMPLNVPEHGWILLNVPEYAWINSSDCARVLTRLQYVYNNIIIVTNVIILEFLPPLFVHLGALLPLHLFQHGLKQE